MGLRRQRGLVCAVLLACLVAAMPSFATAAQQPTAGGVLVIDAAAPGGQFSFMPNSAIYNPGQVTTVDGDSYPVGPSPAALLGELTPSIASSQVIAAEVVGTFPSTSYYPATASEHADPQASLFAGQSQFFSANGGQGTATDSLIVPSSPVPIQSQNGTPLWCSVNTAPTALRISVSIDPNVRAESRTTPSRPAAGRSRLS